MNTSASPIGSIFKVYPGSDHLSPAPSLVQATIISFLHYSNFFNGLSAFALCPHREYSPQSSQSETVRNGSQIKTCLSQNPLMASFFTQNKIPKYAMAQRPHMIWPSDPRCSFLLSSHCSAALASSLFSRANTLPRWPLQLLCPLPEIFFPKISG